MGLLDGILAWADNKRRVGASNAKSLLSGDSDTLNQLIAQTVEDAKAYGQNLHQNAGAFRSVMPGVREASAEQALNGLLNVGGLGAIKAGGIADPNKAIVDVARKSFGTTYSPQESGYMLPDGTMLDMTGRHYSTGYTRSEGRYVPELGKPDYLRGTRSVDHRELPEAVHALLPKNDGGSAGMRMFMEEANALRLAPEVGFETSFVPTDAQLREISNQWKYAPEGLSIDVAHPKTGETLASTVLNNPTPAKIRNFVSDALKDYNPSGGTQSGGASRMKITDPTDGAMVNAAVAFNRNGGDVAATIKDLTAWRAEMEKYARFMTDGGKSTFADFDNAIAGIRSGKYGAGTNN